MTNKRPVKPEYGDWYCFPMPKTDRDINRLWRAYNEFDAGIVYDKYTNRWYQMLPDLHPCGQEGIDKEMSERIDAREKHQKPMKGKVK
jgi:hypothetical protein